ncbi:MAG: hypothetical protein ACREPE_06675, partial [Lysobacter sp.]
YIRGLALRAIDAGDTELMIYRGKNVDRPRIESEAKIGTTISVVIALEALRANDFVTIDVVLGIPGGPNSGLSCKLLVQPNGTV